MGFPAFLPLVTVLAKQPPADDDVVAGWTMLILFLCLGAVVAFLAWSMRKQLRKADRASEAGLYDPSDPRDPVQQVDHNPEVERDAELGESSPDDSKNDPKNN